MPKKRVFFENFDAFLAYDAKFARQKTQNDLLFLHGWGSTKELMDLAFDGLFANFNRFFIDLPGFGQSDTPTRPLTTQNYAQILKIFCNTAKISPKIIVGHSFGGKIAILLAQILNSHVILLSSAGILTQKSKKTRIKILLAKILRFMNISANFLRSSDVRAMNDVMYGTFKNVVNENFVADFARFGAIPERKTAIFWGVDDEATPLASGQKISKIMKNSEFFPLPGDHFFFVDPKNSQKIAEISEKIFQKGDE